MMHSWKEKVAEKLSLLLGDSPSSPSHLMPTDSAAVARSDHQAVPFSIEESSSPKKSTFSSFFLSLLPTASFGVDGHESNKQIRPHSSLPQRWKSNGFKWKGIPLNKSADEIENESDETVGISKDNPDHEPGRKNNEPIGIEEASTSNDSGEFLHYLTEKSTFISADLYDFLQSSLPNIVKGRQWVLLYSTLKHGISLRTLLRRSVTLPGPCLLIVGDMQGAVLGGLLDSSLKPTAKRKYQGTNQTFVFTTIYGEPRLFRATGANRYYYLCVNDLLAFGGGGNFALCLDEDLLHGSSGPCETFGNSCLAHSLEFELKNVELWGFSHFSRYLT